jgi:hypothetical protein
MHSGRTLVHAAVLPVVADVFSSDRDFTLWPPGTELTIELGGTSLVLPVVAGEAALGRALGDATG